MFYFIGFTHIYIFGSLSVINFNQIAEADARRCSVKRVFLKILPSLQENICVSVFFDKVARWKLKACNFFKKETSTQVFSHDFQQNFREHLICRTFWTAASGAASSDQRERLSLFWNFTALFTMRDLRKWLVYEFDSRIYGKIPWKVNAKGRSEILFKINLLIDHFQKLTFPKSFPKITFHGLSRRTAIFRTHILSFSSKQQIWISWRELFLKWINLPYNHGHNILEQIRWYISGTPPSPL